MMSLAFAHHGGRGVRQDEESSDLSALGAGLYIIGVPKITLPQELVAAVLIVHG